MTRLCHSPPCGSWDPAGIGGACAPTLSPRRGQRRGRSRDGSPWAAAPPGRRGHLAPRLDDSEQGDSSPRARGGAARPPSTRAELVARLEAAAIAVAAGQNSGGDPAADAYATVPGTSTFDAEVCAVGGAQPRRYRAAADAQTAASEIRRAGQVDEAPSASPARGCMLASATGSAGNHGAILPRRTRTDVGRVYSAAAEGDTAASGVNTPGGAAASSMPSGARVGAAVGSSASTPQLLDDVATEATHCQEDERAAACGDLHPVLLSVPAGVEGSRAAQPGPKDDSPEPPVPNRRRLRGKQPAHTSGGAGAALPRGRPGLVAPASTRSPAAQRGAPG